MQRHALTLIELLIAVSVIAIFAAILLTVIGSVRESAHRVACANNLRQWGVGVSAFAQDHRGSVPGTACSEGGSRVTPLIWITNAPSWSPDDLTWSKIEDYLTTTGSTIDPSMAHVRGTWSCPSANWTKNIGVTSGVGLNPEFVQFGYSYFGRTDLWSTLNVITPATALTERRLDPNRLLMADAMYAIFDGRCLPVNHTRSRARAGGNRTELAGLNRLFGDGRVIWKDRTAFDLPALLAQDPAQQDLLQSYSEKFFNF